MKGADFMQTDKSQRENYAQSGRFSQRIGSTLYSVNVHFKEESRETLEEKILRLITRELDFWPRFYGENSKSDLRSPGNSAIIGLPQADWLPERGFI